MTTCCRCHTPCAVAILDHRAAPDRSLCPACLAETRRLVAAIPAALRQLADEMRQTNEEAA